MSPDGFDLGRIFFGDFEPIFFLEIILRTTVLFAYTLVLLRLTGARSIAQLSFFEFAIIIGLGSAVGDPMFYPDVPVVHGIVVITLVVMFHRGLVEITLRSRKAQRALEGGPHLVIRDGVVDMKQLMHTKISTDELFMELRQKEVFNLGQVKRVYIEADGKFSIFKAEGDERFTGLCIFPDEIPNQKHGDRIENGGEYACTACGRVQSIDSGAYLSSCEKCEEKTWQKVHEVAP